MSKTTTLREQTGQKAAGRATYALFCHHNRDNPRVLYGYRIRAVSHEYRIGIGTVSKSLDWGRCSPLAPRRSPLITIGTSLSASSTSGCAVALRPFLHRFCTDPPLSLRRALWRTPPRLRRPWRTLWRQRSAPWPCCTSCSAPCPRSSFPPSLSFSSACASPALPRVPIRQSGSVLLPRVSFFVPQGWPVVLQLLLLFVPVSVLIRCNFAFSASICSSASYMVAGAVAGMD